MSIAFRQIDERWKDYFEKFWSLTNDRRAAICYLSSQTISNRSCYNKHFSLFSLAPKMSHSSRCLGRIWTLIDWAWRFELVYWNDSIARAPGRAPAVAAIIKVKCKCLTIMMLLTFFCPNVNLVCAIKAQPIKCFVTRWHVAMVYDPLVHPEIWDREINDSIDAFKSSQWSIITFA